MIHALIILKACPSFYALLVSIKPFKFMNALNPIKLSTTSTALFKFLDYTSF